MSDSWRLTLPCTREEAERLKDDIGVLALLDSPPVLMTREQDAARPDDWRLDVYFDGPPDADTLARLRELVPSAAGITAEPEPLPDEDWVTLSQAGLEPIAEGRFYIHTAAHADDVPAGSTAFRIEAGRAFGTGQHETTAGCLALLDRMKRRGMVFRRAADIGTGTGVLAFAIARTWPARVIASDIDPVSIEVAAENARDNGLVVGRGPGRLELVVADGMKHRRLRASAPYDLLVANILAGPLIDLAPAIAAALAPGGRLILAGLLTTQAEAVIAAYRRAGCRVVERLERGDWTILGLRRNPRP